jgi:hypothetical protein
MFKTDFDDFEALLTSTADLMGKNPPKSAQVAMFFRVMARYSIEDIRNALEAHLRDSDRGRFFPAPADLIAKIDARQDPRPDADEAWAIALKAQDEFETVVWTQDMAQAWGICKPVLSMGDEVGARMAFKDAYNRIVRESKERGEKVSWNVSLGFDAAKRTQAIEHARQLGHDVPLLENNTPLLEQKMPEDVREKLKDLLMILTAPKTAWHEKGEAERAEFEARKKEAEKRVRDFIDKNLTDPFGDVNYTQNEGE